MKTQNDSRQLATDIPGLRKLLSLPGLILSLVAIFFLSHALYSQIIVAEQPDDSAGCKKAKKSINSYVKKESSACIGALHNHFMAAAVFSNHKKQYGANSGLTKQKYQQFAATRVQYQKKCSDSVRPPAALLAKHCYGINH